MTYEKKYWLGMYKIDNINKWLGMYNEIQIKNNLNRFRKIIPTIYIIGYCYT